MNSVRNVWLCLLCICCAGSSTLAPAASVYPAPGEESADYWFAAGRKHVEQAKQQRSWDRAKNVILFVGDGMGVSTVTAARILDGQLTNGQSGEEQRLTFERFPFSALSKTYNTDLQVSDSAGTMTAMVTGIKTRGGVLSVNQQVVRGNCDTQRGNEVVTLLEQAEEAGLSTGLVSTARLTHATPAAAYAHSVDRDWETDAEMSAGGSQGRLPGYCQAADRIQSR